MKITTDIRQYLEQETNQNIAKTVTITQKTFSGNEKGIEDDS